MCQHNGVLLWQVLSHTQEVHRQIQWFPSVLSHLSKFVWPQKQTVILWPGHCFSTLPFKSIHRTAARYFIKWNQHVLLVLLYVLSLTKAVPSLRKCEMLGWWRGLHVTRGAGCGPQGLLPYCFCLVVLNASLHQTPKSLCHRNSVLMISLPAPSSYPDGSLPSLPPEGFIWNKCHSTFYTGLLPWKSPPHTHSHWCNFF